MYVYTTSPQNFNRGSPLCTGFVLGTKSARPRNHAVVLSNNLYWYLGPGTLISWKMRQEQNQRSCSDFLVHSVHMYILNYVEYCRVTYLIVCILNIFWYCRVQLMG